MTSFPEPPRVTVLLCAHNAETTVRAAVESVLAQTFRDFELLLVDDGSTDGTRAVLESFTDPRVRLHLLPENIGLTRALNAGLPLACGALIARLDADDTALPERLERQVAFLDTHPEVGVVGSAYEMRPPGRPAILFREPVSETAMRFGLLFDNTLAHPTVLIRREFLARGYDPDCRYAQEYALWASLWDRCRWAKLPETLVVYGHADSRISVNNRPEQARIAAAISLGLMRRLLPGRTLTAMERDEADAAWPVCPIPATPASLRGAALVLDLFAAFRRQPFVDQAEAARMRRAWLLRMLNSIRVDQLGAARRAGFLGRAFRTLPFTTAWYAGLRLLWAGLNRLGIRWRPAPS